MKKIGFAGVALALMIVMLMTAGCAGGRSQAGKDSAAVSDSAGSGVAGGQRSAYEYGLEIIEFMDKMAESREYLELMSSTEALTERLLEVGEGDYSSKPLRVYKITFSNEFQDFALRLAGANMDGIPKELQEYLLKRARGGMVNMLNAREGAILVASSICSYQKIFVSDELKEDTAYLYVYDNAVPVLVFFQTGENGAVLASGSFIVDDSLSFATEDDVYNTFAMYAVKVEKLELP